MTIKGLGNLLKKLDALGGNTKEALRVGIHQSIKVVQGDAKMLCPVAPDGGLLRNSIDETMQVTSDKVTGKVSTNVEYAPYVEFGTGQRGEESPSPPKADIDLNYRQDWTGMDAQPFLYPALKQNEDIVLKRVASVVRKKIREVAGK